MAFNAHCLLCEVWRGGTRFPGDRQTRRPITMQVVYTSTMAPSCLGIDKPCVSVGIHRGTCWNGHVLLRQDGHAHTEHHNYRQSFHGVKLQSKGCCRLHCWHRSGPKTQRMSLSRCCSSASKKCRLLSTVTRLIYSPFDPAVKTTESIFCGLLSQSCGYQGGCGSASVVAC